MRVQFQLSETGQRVCNEKVRLLFIDGVVTMSTTIEERVAILEKTDLSETDHPRHSFRERLAENIRHVCQ
jgi:hypothetical protein